MIRQNGRRASGPESASAQRVAPGIATRRALHLTYFARIRGGDICAS